MTKILAIWACGLTLACFGLAPAPAAAQEAVLEDFYGSGVHRYFAGDYSAAIADLDAAINGGSRDPRAYYFRGLARQRMGSGGTEDFKTGAALETADTDQYYPVGKSLERIQGSTRMTIERYRTMARATALTQQRRRDAARYQQLQQREQHVLRAPMPGPAAPATAVEPVPAAPPVPDPPASADPFADAPEAAPEVAPKAAEGTPAAPAPSVAAPPTTTPAPASPAPGTPPPPVAEPPAADMPAEDDPFAEPPAADDAPADDSAPAAEMPAEEEPAATEDPAPEPAPADEDDPFAVP